jgi:hypothetical protein
MALSAKVRKSDNTKINGKLAIVKAWPIASGSLNQGQRVSSEEKPEISEQSGMRQALKETGLVSAWLYWHCLGLDIGRA